MIARTLALLVGLIVATSAGAQTPPAPLVLEMKIPLGSISGRIDHLAIDLKRKWLLVAELGNDSLGVVNVVAGKVLLATDGVLVWVDPIHQGKTRAALDALLRGVASRGAWVSAHPDVILKVGVKEVLYRTKHLGWGTDTHLYRTAAEFGAAFPRRLQSSGPRVIKQNRGNGGQGVWKVEEIATRAGAVETVRVLHAQRGSIPRELRLQEFMARCEPYFDWGGCIFDQPFQRACPTE